MTLSKKILLVLLLTLSVASFSPLAIRKSCAQTGQLYFEPTPLSLEAVGSTGTIEVMLDGVDGLSAFDVEITYDTSVVQVDGVVLSSAVGGSTVGPKIDNEVGEVSFGSWTLEKETDGSFVNILDTSQTPVVLASITVTAVGEGNSDFSFSKVNTLDTAGGGDGNPLPITVSTETGQVQVGSEPPPPPPPPPPPEPGKITLQSGGNKIVWPAGTPALSGPDALSSIDSQCETETAPTISRRNHGWLESFRLNQGGVFFDLLPNIVYYINGIKNCVWNLSP